MEVFVYVEYRQDKDTGKEQFETPEVYATKEAAELRYANAMCEIQEEFSRHFRIRGIKADGSVENRGRRNRSEDKAVSL